MCLNPYCSGQWSRTKLLVSIITKQENCLNPYCSGQWSRTWWSFGTPSGEHGVLILIVVDNGLVHVLELFMAVKAGKSLNPYCSGQWSRTYEDFS